MWLIYRWLSAEIKKGGYTLKEEKSMNRIKTLIGLMLCISMLFSSMSCSSFANSVGRVYWRGNEHNN